MHLFFIEKQKEGTPAKDKSTFFIPHPGVGCDGMGVWGSKCRSLRGGSVQLAPKRPQSVRRSHFFLVATLMNTNTSRNVFALVSEFVLREDKRDGLVTEEDGSSSGRRLRNPRRIFSRWKIRWTPPGWRNVTGTNRLIVRYINCRVLRLETKNSWQGHVAVQNTKFIWENYR